MTTSSASANEPGQPVGPSDSVISTVDIPTPDVALAVGAHPDDVEFGCGGTLAKWAAAGCVIHHLVLTDGSKGTWDPDADTATLVAVRRDEQREAARRLGSIGEVLFLDQVDGELSGSRELCGEIARHIRRLRPTVVLGHDPWKRYRLHPDHRHAGWLTCDAVVAARDPHFFREHGIAHHRPATLLLWEADQANHGEDIGASIDTKIQALLAHASQFESTMKATGQSDLDRFADRIRSRSAVLGERISRPHAELFARISDL